MPIIKFKYKNFKQNSDFEAKIMIEVKKIVLLITR